RRLDSEPASAFEYHALLRRELVEPRLPRRGFRAGDESHPTQRLMQLFVVARIGPGFLAHALHGRGIERAELLWRACIERAARIHRLRASLFDRGVVEESIRANRQDRARERRGLGRVDG